MPGKIELHKHNPDWTVASICNYQGLCNTTYHFFKSISLNAIQSVKVYLSIFSPGKINSPPELLYWFRYCRSLHTIQCRTDFSDSLNYVIYCFMLVLIRNVWENRLIWSQLWNPVLLPFLLHLLELIAIKNSLRDEYLSYITQRSNNFIKQKPQCWELPYSSVPHVKM